MTWCDNRAMKPIVVLVLIVIHIVICTALLGDAPLFLAFSLLWLLAFIGTNSISPSSSPDHQDVASWMRSDIGSAIVYRDWWMPKKVTTYTYATLGLLLFGPGLAWALHHVATNVQAGLIYRQALGAMLISPIIVLGAGGLACLFMQIPVMVIAHMFLMLFALVAGFNHPEFIAPIGKVVVVYIALLYTVDLARKVRLWDLFLATIRSFPVWKRWPH